MTSPFSRLLWKEFRSLRVLWLGCLLGTFGLWGFIALALLASSDPYRGDDMLFFVWTLALWLPAIYVIGSNSALFAGEREERTADWLTHVAVPFRSLLAAKLLWPAVSGAVMQLILIGGALLTQALVGRLTSPTLATLMDSLLPDLPRLASFALVEALALSWFWSLQFSRPLPAAAASATSLIAINLVCGILDVPAPAYTFGGVRIDPADVIFGAWGLLRTPFIIGLLVVNGYLTRAWLTGRATQWTIPWDRLRARRRVRTSEIVPQLPTAWQREWQRFRWLEWQSIRPFLQVIAVTAMVLAAATFAWESMSSRSNGGKLTIVWLVFLGYLIPLMAGLAAWQSEQTNSQYRFLICRGVSPFGLWLNKLGMWLTALFALEALLVVLAGISLYAATAGLELPASKFNDYVLETVNQMTREAPPIHFFVWSIAVLFIGSFAVSLYFRRAVLAIGCGFIVYVGLTWWLVVENILQLPAWLRVAPLAAWLVWCGYRQLPRWSLERTDWRSRRAIALDWCVFPVLYAAAVAAWWAYSVPMPDVNRLLYSQFTPQQFFDPASTDWTVVREQSRGLLHRSVDDDVRKLRDALLSRIAMKPGTDFADGLQRESFHEVHHVHMMTMLMNLAEHDLEAGRFEESEKSARAAVRYVGVLHVDAPLLSSPLTVKSLLHHELHKQLLAWAEHPANRPETIALLLKKIEQGELRWWATDELSLEAEYEAMAADRRLQLKVAGWRQIFLLPEFARQRRLAATAISNLHRHLRQTRIPQRNFAAFPPADVQRTNQLLPLSDSDAAWNHRDRQTVRYALGGTIPPNVPWGLSNAAITQLWDRETRIRCTCAALAAIAYRRSHGEMPRTLADVTPEFASQTLVTDPWTGNLLHIDSKGLPSELHDLYSRQTVMAARTPFVWSSGPDLALIGRIGQDEQQHIYSSQTFVQMMVQPTRYVFALPVKTFPDALLPENGAANANANEPRTK